MKIFMDNKHKIAMHNSRYERGEVPFKAGVNKYADMVWIIFMQSFLFKLVILLEFHLFDIPVSDSHVKSIVYSYTFLNLLYKYVSQYNYFMASSSTTNS